MMEKSDGLVETRSEEEELVKGNVLRTVDTTDNNGKDGANLNNTENMDGLNSVVRVPTSARIFEGQYRDHWKVGARIELRHGSYYLTGTVTRADLTIARDVYDVQLDSGDVVYNVPSCDLRTPHLSFGLKVGAGIVVGGVTIVSLFTLFVCTAEMLIIFANNQRALR